MGLRGTAMGPGRRPLPQVLRRVEKVQNTHSRGRELLRKQAPQPGAAITEPDPLRRPDDALAERFEPQARLECLDVPQDRHQPTVLQPRHAPARPRAMLTQTGPHAYFDLAPAEPP